MPHVSPMEAVPVALGVRFVVRALLIPFAAMAGYFVAWGLVFVMDAVVRAFFGNLSSAVGWIPFANRVVQTPILAIEHKLTSYLGGLEAHFENQMAARWHALAALVSSLAADTKAAAIFDYHLAGKLATLWGNAATGGLMKDHAKPAKQAKAQAQTATHTATAANKAAHAAVTATAGAVAVPTPQTKVIVRTYPAGRLGTRTKALEAELGHVIDWTIPGLRARDQALSESIGRLWHRVRGDAKRIAAGAAVGALVYALGKLGMGSLRCGNVGKVAKRLCGMNPGWLEALLAGATAILGAISLEAFTHVMIDAMDEITSAVQAFIRETHGIPSRSAAEQGFAATGGGIAFRSASDQGFV